MEYFTFLVTTSTKHEVDTGLYLWLEYFFCKQRKTVSRYKLERIGERQNLGKALAQRVVWRNAWWQERKDAAEAPSGVILAHHCQWDAANADRRAAGHCTEPCKGDKKKLWLGNRQESQETTRKNWWHWCAKIKRKVVNNSDVNRPGEGTELSRGQEAGIASGCATSQNIRLQQGSCQ